MDKHSSWSLSTNKALSMNILTWMQNQHLPFYWWIWSMRVQLQKAQWPGYSPQGVLSWFSPNHLPFFSHALPPTPMLMPHTEGSAALFYSGLHTLHWWKKTTPSIDSLPLAAIAWACLISWAKTGFLNWALCEEPSFLGLCCHLVADMCKAGGGIA